MGDVYTSVYENRKGDAVPVRLPAVPPRAGSHRHIPYPLIGFAVLLAMLSGCDLLLGPDPTDPGSFQAPQWEVRVVTEGEISGLDLALLSDGSPVASYVHEAQVLRVSRLEGGEWISVDGPASGAIEGGIGAISTHIAVAPDGSASVLYGTDSEVSIVQVDGAAGTPLSLASLQVAIRDTLYPPPATWTIESSTLAYGADGRLRVIARDADTSRLWLFREEAGGWTLGVVPFSTNVAGSVQLKVADSGNEHVLFQANSQGFYVWWRPSEKWSERLRFVAGLPYLLRLRADEASVLATRDKSRLQVAEEQYNPAVDRYRWEVREVVNDESLYWHNYDLVLDEMGFPTHIYILGPIRQDRYEVWITRLNMDGSWGKALVAANLQFPVFNPFNVRMVRGSSGRLHVLLTTGERATNSGGTNQWQYRLIHLQSDSPFGD